MSEKRKRKENKEGEKKVEAEDERCTDKKRDKERIR